MAALAIAALASPWALGVMGAPQIRGLAMNARGTPPSFEVASIKLTRAKMPLPGIHLFNDRFNATSPALELITWAYSPPGRTLSRDQLSGGPGWIKSDLYDIDAKVDDSLVEGEWKKLSFDQKWDQAMLMLQTLLAQRFKLKISHGTKVLPVYELVLAKNGPKFAEDNSHPEIGAIVARGRGRFELISGEFNLFAGLLGHLPELGGRVVLDKTGLTSHYSFTFQWTPETLGAMGGRAEDDGGAVEAAGPSLFTALQEQLGLKLVPTKAPVDVIVIDHIERPSEN